MTRSARAPHRSLEDAEAPVNRIGKNECSFRDADQFVPVIPENMAATRRHVPRTPASHLDTTLFFLYHANSDFLNRYAAQQ